MAKKVLVTDGTYKHTLAAVRSFGVRGVDVDVASHTKKSVSFFSKYCRKKILYSRINDKVFIQQLLKVVRKNEYDALIPIGLVSTSRISESKKEFERYTNVPIANYSELKIASKKDETMKLADKIGIPIPKTYFPRNEDELKKMSSQIQYPVVIKSTSEQLSGNVRYANTPKDFLRRCTEVCNTTPKEMPIVQEYIVGDGYGFFALFKQGEPKAVFQHHRLMEYPITGGPSVMAESIYDPILEELGLKILKKLKWHGVAMVEFKKDCKTGEFKLMEINPKFWGSLDLAISSGVDFPYLAYKMAINGDIDYINKYKIGVKFYWPFPYGILHALAQENRFTAVNESIGLILNKNMKTDVWLKDFKPTLYQLRQTIGDVYSRTKNKTLRFPHGKPVGDKHAGI